MTESHTTDVEQHEHEFKNYLPGMPRVSSEPGRLERALKTLFRERGPVQVVVRRKER